MEAYSTVKAAPHLTSDKSSFAYVSVKDHWPKIVTGTLDDVHRTIVSSTDESKVSEGKIIVAGLATLKYELQHDRRLTPLANDGQPYVEDYNEALEALGPVKWFSAPWLFAECYLYRRIHTFFSLSTHWRSHDPFSRQKMSLLGASRSASLEAAAQYRAVIVCISSKTSDDALEEARFAEVFSLNLKANASGSSLLSPLALNPSCLSAKDPGDTLANDLSNVYQTLKAARLSKRADRSVSIVLSTAGLPLLASLLLSSYLLTTGLATHIILHPKSFPWSVTDATPADFASLLSLLADPQTFFDTPSEEDLLSNPESATRPPLTAPEVEDLTFLFQHMTALYAEGKMVLRPQPFWTSSFDYWDLSTRAPGLFADLKEAELVIFQGDWHYRKLTADAKWPSTTSFEQAIGPLGKGSGVRVLVLRSSDVDAGNVGLDEEVIGQSKTSTEEGEEMSKRGSGIVQFYDGKC